MLVYVGAVMVLFLFVVMMLDIDLEPLREGFVPLLPIGLVVAVVMLVEMLDADRRPASMHDRRAPADPRPRRHVEHGVARTRAVHASSCCRSKSRR